ncbi:hypothetical protein BO78DRAFT_420002 [Aspergillus sclerotiicarbonarius CBS 121057]|uniref:Hydrophobin n=1 Tax=Aspergillus sclerotiicarbonarius (strain CBS 121057 / IBT 28362) TaxID=1448318 RepID=A0A319E4W5_ASPSB|nr:hypothetical protein BO78DRAFT_420002 [Aspergillus sclerotiicarbonarius CBS 121057]
MKFIIAAVVGFAMTATAIPAAATTQQKLSIDEAKSQCSTGDIYCCDTSDKDDTSGFLTNLAANGLLLSTLVNGKESSCASSSLLKDIDVLAFFEKGDDDNNYCKNTIACCIEGDCAVLDDH